MDLPYTTGAIALGGTRPSEAAFDALVIVGSAMPKSARVGLRSPVDFGLVGDARVTWPDCRCWLATTTGTLHTAGARGMHI